MSGTAFVHGRDETFIPLNEIPWNEVKPSLELGFH